VDEGRHGTCKQVISSKNMLATGQPSGSDFVPYCGRRRLIVRVCDPHPADDPALCQRLRTDFDVLFKGRVDRTDLLNQDLSSWLHPLPGKESASRFRPTNSGYFPRRAMTNPVYRMNAECARNRTAYGFKKVVLHSCWRPVKCGKPPLRGDWRFPSLLVRVCVYTRKGKSSEFVIE